MCSLLRPPHPLTHLGVCGLALRALFFLQDCIAVGAPAVRAPRDVCQLHAEFMIDQLAERRQSGALWISDNYFMKVHSCLSKDIKAVFYRFEYNPRPAVYSPGTSPQNLRRAFELPRVRLLSRDRFRSPLASC